MYVQSNIMSHILFLTTSNIYKQIQDIVNLLCIVYFLGLLPHRGPYTLCRGPADGVLSGLHGGGDFLVQHQWLLCWVESTGHLLAQAGVCLHHLPPVHHALQYHAAVHPWRHCCLAWADQGVLPSQALPLQGGPWHPAWWPASYSTSPEEMCHGPWTIATHATRVPMQSLREPLPSCTGPTFTLTSSLLLAPPAPISSPATPLCHLSYGMRQATPFHCFCRLSPSMMQHEKQPQGYHINMVLEVQQQAICSQSVQIMTQTHDGRLHYMVGANRFNAIMLMGQLWSQARRIG